MYHYIKKYLLFNLDDCKQLYTYLSNIQKILTKEYRKSNIDDIKIPFDCKVFNNKYK